MSWANGYDRKALFTFNVYPASTLTDFPNLILGTYAALADVAHGGYVQHTVTLNGQTVPADLIFTSDSAGTTLLSWEVVSWNNTTGAIVVWIKATRSSSSDTLIYAWVGNSSVTTYQCTASATWDSHYLTVWHLNSVTSAVDSTSHGYTGTAYNSSYLSEGSGPIGGAAYSSAYGYFATGTQSALGPAAVTVSAWINPSAAAGHWVDYGSFNGYLLLLNSNQTISFMYDTGHGPTSSVTVPLSAWSYVVGTGDAGGGVVYVAGASEGTNGSAYMIFNGPYGLMALDGQYGGYATGGIAEVRISDTVRSPDWIAHEYRQQNQASPWYTVGTWDASSTQYAQAFTAVTAAMSAVLPRQTGRALFSSMAALAGYIPKRINKVLTGG